MKAHIFESTQIITEIDNKGKGRAIRNKRRYRGISYRIIEIGGCK